MYIFGIQLTSILIVIKYVFNVFNYDTYAMFIFFFYNTIQNTKKIIYFQILNIKKKSNITYINIYLNLTSS